jgi:hypothetical protein
MLVSATLLIWEFGMENVTTLQYLPTTAQQDLSPKNLQTTLFILSHPDLDRIGDYCVCSDLGDSKPFEINRLTPYFTPSNLPVADPFMSRMPIHITKMANGDLNLSTDSGRVEMSVGGQRGVGHVTVCQSAVETGVTIEISQRITLLLKNVAPVKPPDFEKYRMHGLSRQLSELCQRIGQLERIDEPVLIKGETGTGKELVAQALVANSLRRNKPLVCVNLAAIAPTLAAAELFGVAKGAFTGADKSRAGYFVAADGGTLFLDEIGEASIEVQAMLLRVLETREIFPLGSNKGVRVDVRIIAATYDNKQRLYRT